MRTPGMALASSLTFAAALVHAGSAIADRYPSKPVRMVVGVAAGGTPDNVARLIGQWLAERLGQSFIVDNRPGAGSNIATEIVTKAAPDGYTLLLLAPSSVISPTISVKLNFDFLRDIAPVAGITRQPQVMLVHPSVPAKSVPEFIAYAKVNPGKLNFASSGTGTHLFGELFKMMAGIDMVHVPYRGGGLGLNDLLGGQVQVSFSTTVTSIDHIRDGTLRALAVTSATRLEAMPDVPAMAEFIPGYETNSVFGVGAPRNTPTAIVNQLNQEINAALADPKIKARLSELGGTVISGSPADFGKLIVEEIERWAKVVKFSGLKSG